MREGDRGPVLAENLVAILEGALVVQRLQLYPMVDALVLLDAEVLPAGLE